MLKLNIHSRYLNDLDTYIRSNLFNICCSEMSEIYFEFATSLKECSGISANYEWLSEFIVFRFVYHCLGSTFKKVSDTKVKEVFIHPNGLVLASNKEFTVRGTKQQPDITVMEKESIKKLISVKTTILKTYEDFGRIKNLRHDEHSNFNSVTVIFGSMIDARWKEMNSIHRENNWHDYIVLAENDNIFYEELKQKLNLCR